MNEHLAPYKGTFKSVRKSVSLTQTEAANLLGVNRSTVQNWEAKEPTHGFGASAANVLYYLMVTKPENEKIATFYDKIRERSITGIPELENNCKSWIVVSRETGKPVFETRKRAVAEAINLDAYEVLTATQWLQRLNQSIAKGK